MSAKQSKWLLFGAPVFSMVGVILAAYISMNADSAVLAEQIRTMQDDTRCLQADAEKHEVRIRNAELETKGLGGSIEAVRVIAADNATKLNILIKRGH